MKSGLYILASLDGGPLAESDCETMGFAAAPGPSELRTAGLAVRAADSDESGGAAHFVTTSAGAAVLLGHLDEPEELAAGLGTARDASPAQLALLALERFGADAAAHLLGEWSLLSWQTASRQLTLLASEACRDPMFFATDGRRVAVAPEARRLARLGFVDAAFDPEGLLLQLSRARLRRSMTGETFLRGVRRVVPGSREIFGETSRSTSRPRAPLQPPLWQGSFEEAVAAVERTLRRIVRQNLARQETCAFLLSGGLDSSTLAWLGSEERDRKQELFFLTSVAPPGSGIADEREFSEIVARRLELPLVLVSPPDTASPFAPSARMFAHMELPVASPRHYLYDALYDAALSHGANGIFDGVYGELSVTSKIRRPPDRSLLGRAAFAARSWLRARRERNGWPANGFHVRLSRDALARVRPEWTVTWRAAYEPQAMPHPTQPWGFRPAVQKNAMTATSTACARLRQLMPFRDRRLLRLAASFPAEFLWHGGTTRALARVLLKNRLPDSVRLRPSGGPFSPDWDARLRSHARGALDRIDLFRAAGAGTWLDLEWLAGELKRLPDRSVMDVGAAVEVQATAVAAEFFAWWEAQRSA